MNPKLTPKELLGEVQWLLDSDLHPEHIAKQTGRTIEAISIIARRHGEPDIARVFNRVLKAQKLRAAA